MTDVKKLITEHLDIWLTAETEKKSGRGRSSNSSNSIYGVQKLRELILELAVTGRLTNQKKDEDAKELLSCLLAERAELIKQKKIRNSKVNSIDKSQFHVDIPDTWEVCNLGSISKKLTDGSHNPPANNGSGFPMLSSQNINDSKIDFENPSRFVDQSGFEIENARTDIKTGDVLLTIVGTIGRSAVVPQQAPKFVLQRSVAVIQTGINPYYLSLYFHSPLCINYFLEHGKGTAQKGIYLNKLSDLPLVLPPLEEQQRIVAKVDELMQLCDQLEQQQNLSSEAHDQLVDTLLNVLINSSDVNEFQKNWQRISENFDLLFTTEYSIEQLKQTILQLAVMGKLVKQDPNDEPASELLKQIADEKSKLIKEGKIKKSKPLPEISDEEKPYEIPNNWTWVYLNNIAYVGTGATPSRTNPEYWNPKDVNWLSSGETANDFIEKTNEMVSKLALRETNLTVYPVGSLIIAMYGQGKTRGQITELNIPATTNQACAGIIPILNAVENRRYIKLFFQKIYDEIREIAEGGAQPNLNLNKIQQTKIPLPPISEQKRIVEKVEQLFSFIERLKELQRKLQSTKLYLAESFIRNALSDSNDKSKLEVPDNIIQFEKPIEIVKQSKQKSADQIDLFADDSGEDDIKLLSLAAEITFQLHTESTFGHLKLQKLVYLCQQLKHMDLAADFKQHAAGPYDPVMARYLDKEFKNREWFSYDPKRDLKYKPLSRCNDHRSAFNRYFAEDVSEIYDLIGLFRTSKSDHIEIVATLFACWLRLLEKKLSVTEEQLLKDFYAWSEEKKRFSKAEVLTGYKWMHQYSVIPQL
ncbi:restriction endonuclease subunit S [Acinetobacter baumannii]|uniref:restriction endonuclease subunit S n=1 Tax=Acinetobacter baumannii TaxID=470 RepID=UPI0023419A0A|nr:restriction endonuclease subunit S [Acinetobacter baumannii]MDC4603305.1 restriction endonuclease subunit S [Acinetobacter baumannii]MDH2519511.1 restriction endonuclease subunit S [Acinetobacter baumannii]MDK2184982.1 restriction endonuclease subunit S [Acinetobacter baumannii]MDK2257791.1 restriction endonuclease subunit S [Acinetobacter baumannii]MDK2264176.1 restriction endonuclease subunit S [Acinetobacter baumannii]